MALAVLVPALALGGMWLTGKSSTPAQANPGVTTLAIDMDPFNGGGNTDVFVGPIDTCIGNIPLTNTAQFDVVYDQIEAGKDLKGYQFFMGFNSANVTFTAQTSPAGCPPSPSQ